jgi:deoxyribodipyrimidine photo-lyase
VVPESRIVVRSDAPVNADGDYVLYWMIAARRTAYSFGLDRALEHARALGKPLVVFEPLRAGHRWASRRIHQFVLQGMVDNAAACRDAGVRYVSYVEPTHGDGAGLLGHLASRAAVVVTDHFPSFFLPRMVASAAASLPVRLEAVDGNGILPLTEAPKTFTVAHAFRRHVQRTVADHLEDRPVAAPLAGYDLGVATVDLGRWGESDPSALLAADLAGIDVAGPGTIALHGGAHAAQGHLDRFLRDGLPRYHEDRNDPSIQVASGLSPYLHFGHVSVHDVFARIEAREAGWRSGDLPPKPNGKREGWWGMSAPSEAFLDEILTWREVGYTFCHREPDYDRFETLPEWAQITLDEHADDARPTVYTLEQLHQARTHDEIWNAAQRQLRREGRIHNYLRMLWGKKVLEWSPSPREAWDRLIDLNNRWAIDGRNPNSYSGIAWTFGRFDRAWGPVRPIFGKVRYMSSDSTRRKLRLKPYLSRWAA